MDIVFVASGSKGNATLLRQGDTLLQIDMGISKKEVATGLKRLNASFDDIAALLLTHNHSDHTKGVGLYHGKIPIYTGPLTLGEEEVFEALEPGLGVEIGDITVLPFAASHDAPTPLNFVFLSGDEKFVYVTDTGTILDENLPLLQNATYYLFESNYDHKMLYASSRPLILKDRIASEVGHLSNADSASYLQSLIGPKTKQIFLGHVSDECNTVEKALKAHLKVYGEKLTEDMQIVAMKQKTMYVGGGLR